MDAATNLIWWAHGGELRYWARCVRRHIFEDFAQPINNVVIVDFIFRHPRRVVVAGVLVPRVSRAISGCTLRFMKLKATCSALSPTSLSALIFANNSGNWSSSCIVGSEFHHGRCLGCFPLGFGSSGWWFVT
jgi:hypothetical protein